LGQHLSHSIAAAQHVDARASRAAALLFDDA